MKAKEWDEDELIRTLQEKLAECQKERDELIQARYNDVVVLTRIDRQLQAAREKKTERGQALFDLWDYCASQDYFILLSVRESVKAALRREICETETEDE